jgi:hypothetical protein
VTEGPPDVNMLDLISAIFLRPEPAKEEADEEEAVQRQIRQATPEEMVELEALAARTASLQDQIKALMGDKAKELSAMKAQLLDRMLTHNLTEIYVRGRPAIEVVIKKDRKPTKKSILAVFTKQLGDAKKAAEETNRLWNAIPQADKESLSIPDATPPEIDSPY